MPLFLTLAAALLAVLFAALWWECRDERDEARADAERLALDNRDLRDQLEAQARLLTNLLTCSCHADRVAK